MDTVSAFRVLPVVALVRSPVDWILNEREVSEVFTVPASVAFRRDNYEPGIYERDGRSYRVWTLRWEGHRIWGVTAAMLMNLVQRLEKARENSDSDLRHSA